MRSMKETTMPSTVFSGGQPRGTGIILRPLRAPGKGQWAGLINLFFFVVFVFEVFFMLFGLSIKALELLRGGFVEFFDQFEVRLVNVFKEILLLRQIAA